MCIDSENNWCLCLFALLKELRRKSFCVLVNLLCRPEQAEEMKG